MAKCECGNNTNDKSGLCIICRLKDRVADNTAFKAGERERKIQKKKKQLEGSEEPMAKTKKCPCGAEFEPTSNRQIYCSECKAKKKPVKKKGPKAPKKSTEDEAPPLSQEEINSSLPTQEEINNSFTITEACENCLHDHVCWLALVVIDNNHNLVSGSQLRKMCRQYRAA